MADSSGFEQRAVERPSIDTDFADIEITAVGSTLAEVDLALCWRELIGGVVTVRGGFFDSGKCGVLLGAPQHPRDAALVGRRLEILESVLAGIGQNCVAIDLGVAPSTVALHARQALETLGVPGRPSRVHPLMMLMATAARRGILVSGKVSYVQSAQGELRAIEVARPGQRLRESLPAAERAVIDLLIEGRGYVEIAEKRHTAVRTVANQIAAVFRRLNVSGRSELIQRLFVVDGLLPPTAALGSVLPPTLHGPLSGRPWSDARISGIRPLAHMSSQLLELAGASARAR
jgi:DNA-binding NarL/FixJ family response regulator